MSRMRAFDQTRVRKPQVRIAVQFSIAALTVPNLFAQERAKDHAVKPVRIDTGVRPESINRSPDETIPIGPPKAVIWQSVTQRVVDDLPFAKSPEHQSRRPSVEIVPVEMVGSNIA